MKVYWAIGMPVLIVATGIAAMRSPQAPPAMAPQGATGASSPEPQPSLADIARRLRAQKAAASATSAVKPRVFTNDNMPRGTIAVLGPVPDNSAAEGATGVKTATGATAKKEDEQVWRAKFAKLRENLNTEQRRLDVLQRELNLAEVQNYSDPNVALREQFDRTELKKRTADIDQEKAAVDAAKQAIADLEEELRKKGLPAGWATP